MILIFEITVTILEPVSETEWLPFSKNSISNHFCAFERTKRPVKSAEGSVYWDYFLVCGKITNYRVGAQP